jgi:hypothetical protein
MYYHEERSKLGVEFSLSPSHDHLLQGLLNTGYSSNFSGEITFAMTRRQADKCHLTFCAHGCPTSKTQLGLIHSAFEAVAQKYLPLIGSTKGILDILSAFGWTIEEEDFEQAIESAPTRASLFVNEAIIRFERWKTGGAANTFSQHYSEAKLLALHVSTLAHRNERYLSLPSRGT